MTANENPKPEKCSNPDCDGQRGFICRGVQFKYDVDGEIGTLEVEQAPRSKIITWECNACHSVIEVRCPIS